MAADQFLCSMDFFGHEDDWLDFDNLFDPPSGYLDSNPTSVDSISPRDFDIPFADAEVPSWDSDFAMCSEALFPDLGSCEPPAAAYGQPALDISEPFINPNVILQPAPFPPQETYLGSGPDSAWLPGAQNVGFPCYSSIRHVVESQAALDPRCCSQKEKRREASIALHLQRIHGAQAADPNSPYHSNNQVSSPYCSNSSYDPTPNGNCQSSATSPPSDSTRKSSPPISGSDTGPAGMQLVLDLNMNVTTNLPRKQKPRSRAQRESYIKARKFGACEKHRRQHKRCNCLEKTAAAHLNLNKPICASPNSTIGLSTDNPKLHVSPKLQINSKLQVNPSLQVNTSKFAVRSPGRSPNTGQTNALARQSIRVPKPDFSPTQPVQQFVSTPGQHWVITQNPHPLPPGDRESPRMRTLYRDKKSQNPTRLESSLLERRPRQAKQRSVDLQPSSVHRHTSDAQRCGVTNISLSSKAGAPACKTALGLFSFWQGSTTLSSWAGVFLGRLVMFSSGLYIRSRKGMGLF